MPGCTRKFSKTAGISRVMTEGRHFSCNIPNNSISTLLHLSDHERLDRHDMLQAKPETRGCQSVVVCNHVSGMDVQMRG